MDLSGLSYLTTGRRMESPLLSWDCGICGCSYYEIGVEASFRLELRERLEPKFEDRLLRYFIRLLIYLAWSSRCFSSNSR